MLELQTIENIVQTWGLQNRERVEDLIIELVTWRNKALAWDKLVSIMRENEPLNSVSRICDFGEDVIDLIENQK